MLPLLIASLHSKAESSEQPEKTDHNNVQSREDTSLYALVQASRIPVHNETTREDCEIQRGIVMVHVRHSCHGDERHVVQEPSDQGVQSRVVELVDLLPSELIVAPLPANGVPANHTEKEYNGESRPPIDGRVAKEEVLDDGVVPTTHAEADVEERPLPGFGSKVILLVRVWDESVVRCHHGDVEVDKVAQEWRLVGTWRAWWDLMVLAILKNGDQD